MHTQITSERQYTISYFKPGTKNAYGMSVTVTGDKKAKVVKEAREVLEKAQQDAMEVHERYYGKVATNEDSS